MPTIDSVLLEHGRADFAALAHLPKTYATQVPAWAGQVTALPGRWRGAASGPLCDGCNVAVAALGARQPRGTDAFAYCWRRFGPPWWGCDDVKDLVGYILQTPHPEVMLSVHLSASALAYGVGYLITHDREERRHAPQQAWTARFEDWWITTKLTASEREALACQQARGARAAIVPRVCGFLRRFDRDRWTRAVVEEAEAAIGRAPCRDDGHDLEVCTALHEALVECLRPVWIDDVAINILGRVPDDQLDDEEAEGARAEAPRSIYAGLGVSQEALDALRKEDV